MGVSFNWITDSTAGPMPQAPPDRTAFVVDGSDPVTYGELRDHELRYASALRGAGVDRGARVAILMRNCAEFVFAVTGTARAGAISVRLNWRLTSSELEFLLTDSDPTVLLLDEEFVPQVAELRGAVSVQTYVVRTDGRDGAGVPSWAVGLEEFAAVPGRDDLPSLTMEDPVSIIYTSGTTGLPKGAVITHGNWLWATAMQSIMFGLDASSVVQVGGPMFHAGAWEILVMAALMRHGTAVLSASGGFTAERFLELGREYGTTTMFIYSHMLYELARREDLESIIPSSLTRIVAGGDIVMPWVYEEFRARLPHIAIDQTYGMTEGGMVCCLLRDHEAAGHETSVGRPNPLTEVRVVGPDDQPVGVDEVGEILTRNPIGSAGFWRRPDENAETFEDGWCRTGDLGRVDRDGFLTMAGRAKDMLRSGGENIFPAEIEKVLTGHGDVEDAAVVGVPDPTFVEVGTAVLVAATGREIDVDRLRAHCAERLARFKIPKYFVVVEDLPRNPSGKVLKSQLREQYASLGESMTTQ